MKIPPLFSLSVLSILVPLTAIAPAGGCATPEVVAPPIALTDEKPPAPDPAPDKAEDTATAPTSMPEVTITDADKDKIIELKVGQRLLVRLPSNPTTGYEWSAAKLDDTTLAPDGETKFDAPETEMAGAPTTQTLFFKAKSAGKLELELKYSRPWEKDKEPVDIYKVNIVTVDSMTD